jgi:hypothetical protein
MGRKAQAPPNAAPVAAAVGEARHELVVVQGHDADHHDDQRHGGQEQGEISVQRAQRGLNGVGHRRNGVGHHRKGKRNEQQRSSASTEAGKAVPLFRCRGEREGHIPLGHGSSLWYVFRSSASSDERHCSQEVPSCAHKSAGTCRPGFPVLHGCFCC